jgi:hypothetical protein
VDWAFHTAILLPKKGFKGFFRVIDERWLGIEETTAATRTLHVTTEERNFLVVATFSRSALCDGGRNDFRRYYGRKRVLRSGDGSRSLYCDGEETTQSRYYGREKYLRSGDF